MDSKECLLEKYYEVQRNYKNSHKAFYTNPSVARIEPFKIADGLYYVGDKKVCVHLIDTGDGLILIDSGYLGAAHLLVDSIWRAGFDPQNVRWIIHTHGHSDHFGASDEFHKMYGTKLAISRVDAEAIRQKPHRAHVNNVSFPYAVIPEFDYEIEDGEQAEQQQDASEKEHDDADEEAGEEQEQKTEDGADDAIRRQQGKFIAVGFCGSSVGYQGGDAGQQDECSQYIDKDALNDFGPSNEYQPCDDGDC